jgi:ATP-binding cassette subfamily C (CFTR/MRP) protein 1
MDNPLSALDAHVKREVFDKVCCSELQNKTRILVTHAIDYLDRVDRIIVMKKGEIIHCGTFDELKNEKYFQIVIEQMNKTKEKDNDSIEENKIENETNEAKSTKVPGQKNTQVDKKKFGR